jgi:hypothetical protein
LRERIPRDTSVEAIGRALIQLLFGERPRRIQHEEAGQLNLAADALLQLGERVGDSVLIDARRRCTKLVDLGDVARAGPVEVRVDLGQPSARGVGPLLVLLLGRSGRVLDGQQRLALAREERRLVRGEIVAGQAPTGEE